MTEEQRNIKTVPIYYENDIVGSAEITTVKCAYAKDAARYFDAWSIKNIKINNCFKFMFLHLYKDHKIYLWECGGTARRPLPSGRGSSIEYYSREDSL